MEDLIMKTKKKNEFRIIRTGEHKYEVWQLTVVLWIFHQWEQIGVTDSYEKAFSMAYAEAEHLGAPCYIDYIDNLL